MSETNNVRLVTEGGVAAVHAAFSLPPALVAPTTAKDQNTIRPPLIPFACWRANDMRFEFESSFILPTISPELAALKELVDRHTRPNERGQPVHKPALSVFGHADPTGSDVFNKALSGRRAQVTYGLLVRKTELWEDIYSNPLGNDKWEPRAIHTMQTTLGLPLSERPNKTARKALFAGYMEHLCTIRDENQRPVLDPSGQTAKVLFQPSDFLAAGADPNGKGDFQGCSEFNPILMFSRAESEEFKAPEKKTSRDAANAPNRRVLVFLFRPGLRIDPAIWPCPRAKEGIDGCLKRFWSDAADRRKFQEKRREFKETRDTFACRFYDRLSSRSPCEKGNESVLVRLFDLAGEPMPDTEFFAEIAGRKIRGKSNKEGDITLLDIELPQTCLLRWSRHRPRERFEPEFDHADVPPALLGGEDTVRAGAAPQPTPERDLDFEFETTLFLEVPKEQSDSPSDDAALERRLHNLGYHIDLPRLIRHEAFSRDHSRTQTSSGSDTADLRRDIVARHDNLTPPPKDRI